MKIMEEDMVRCEKSKVVNINRIRRKIKDLTKDWAELVSRDNVMEI